MNLLAMRIIIQLDSYVSWKADPQAYVIDAVTSMGILFLLWAPSCQHCWESTSEDSEGEGNNFVGFVPLVNENVVPQSARTACSSTSHNAVTVPDTASRANQAPQHNSQTDNASIAIVRCSLQAK